MWMNRSVEIVCVSWNSAGIHIWSGFCSVLRKLSAAEPRAQMNSSSSDVLPKLSTSGSLESSVVAVNIQASGYNITELPNNSDKL